MWLVTNKKLIQKNFHRKRDLTEILTQIGVSDWSIKSVDHLFSTLVGVTVKIKAVQTWFPESAKERKKMRRKIIFFLNLLYKKYEREPNIIKKKKKFHILEND